MISVETSDKKYTFQTKDNDYRIHVLRYGEPWLVIEEGHRAILTLMLDLIEERNKQLL